MLTIIGCGNLNRSDDGVGVIVARLLLEKFPSGRCAKVQIFDAGTDGMAVMFKARGSKSLIIIDAGNTGSEPGAVFEVPGKELEGKPPDSHTLHDFRWDHALYAGRQIFKNDFPGEVRVYLIEAKSLKFGLELSPEVEKSAQVVVDKIARRVEGYVPTSYRPERTSIAVRGGSLYLDAAVYDRYFSGLDAVILLRRERDLFVMPVRNTAGGGYLLKLRNKAGDRIINAMDFFREQGLDESRSYSFDTAWDQKMSALKAGEAFKIAN